MSGTELIAAGAAVVVLLLSLLVLKAWLGARRAVVDADAAIYRLNAVTAERALVIKRAEQIGKALESGTLAVGLGTDVVQTTHNVIADSVFGILGSIPETRDTSAVVKGVHDATADGVYTAISEVNKAIGGVLKGITNPSARKPPPAPKAEPPAEE